VDGLRWCKLPQARAGTNLADFEDNVYGYRPVRGAVDCARNVCNLVTRRREGTLYPDEIEIQEAHSNTVNLTVKRHYLTEREVERLMDGARKHGRYGHRDATMILVAYRHGLRASEVCDLQWQQIELSEGRLHVHRVKNGIPSVHPIRGDEMRALRKLRREYPKDAYVFVSERGGPISPIGFHRLIQRLGEAAKMPFPIHPHMLRHACGFKLANDGHDTRALQHYLGHKNIQHTVRYTEMAPDRFKDFWRG
jgi:integrase